MRHTPARPGSNWESQTPIPSLLLPLDARYDCVVLYVDSPKCTFRPLLEFFGMAGSQHKLWLEIRFPHFRTACVLAAGAGIAVLPFLLRSSPVTTASGASLFRTDGPNGHSWNNSEKICAGLLDESRDIPRPQLSISACVHLLRLYGPQAEVHIDAEKVRVLNLLTDARVGSRFFGQPAFVPTAAGVRFPVMNNGSLSGQFDEAHRDLCLACFAELHLPDDFPLITATGESIDLRLAIIDAIATFHLTQKELEWTTIAFAHYVLDKSWTNRFGEITTFDELAEELLSRQLRKSSCGGAHRLWALSQLLNADCERHILSAAVRRKTVDYVSKALAVLQQTQSPAGFWTSDWSLLLDASGSSQIVSRTLDTQQSRLLVTGHLVEWFRTLPAGLGAPTKIVSRSQSWLLTQINDSTRFWDNCCPLTHVLCALSD